MTCALKLRLLAACWLAATLCTQAAAFDIPYLTGRIVDGAELVSPAARNRLSALLKTHEQATGNQIVLLTVPTIEGESIEEYALKVFENWKLGDRTDEQTLYLTQIEGKWKVRQ